MLGNTNLTYFSRKVDDLLMVIHYNQDYASCYDLLSKILKIDLIKTNNVRKLLIEMECYLCCESLPYKTGGANNDPIYIKAYYFSNKATIKLYVNSFLSEIMHRFGRSPFYIPVYDAILITEIYNRHRHKYSSK